MWERFMILFWAKLLVSGFLATPLLTFDLFSVLMTYFPFLGALATRLSFKFYMSFLVAFYYSVRTAFSGVGTT